MNRPVETDHFGRRQVIDNLGSEISGAGEATKISGPNFSFFDDVSHGIFDALSVLVKTSVVKHVSSGKEHGGWITNIFASD